MKNPGVVITEGGGPSFPMVNRFGQTQAEVRAHEALGKAVRPGDKLVVVRAITVWDSRTGEASSKTDIGTVVIATGLLYDREIRVQTSVGFASLLLPWSHLAPLPKATP